jgi:outer membrane protein
MRKILTAAVLAAATTALSTPAWAGNPEGHWQIKLLGTGVLPDGKITKIDSVVPAVATALGATPGTKANDNVVPTLAVEYFVNPNISVETICCFSTHHVTGTGSIAGADIADHVMILPATVTLKYHLPLKGVKPYLGVGPSVFFYLNEKPGAVPVSLGATSLHMENRVGVALQAGLDVPINNSGMGLSIDAKKYFMNTRTHFYAGSTEVLSTTHKLDPWVISAGVTYRF